MHRSSDRSSSVRAAVAALVLATLFWGCGFTWAKSAGETVNSVCGLAPGAALGPIFVLAARFTSGGLIWLILFPDARRGWSLADVKRSIILGLLLAGGMIVQHLGLDRTSEATSAFLTSLTILFVPLMMTFIVRKPPRAMLWIGALLATAGVWLMTGATPSGFGLGEMLGLACAILYSIDIIVLNMLLTPQSVSRLTAGQFLFVGLINLITCLLLPGGKGALASAGHLMIIPQIGANIALLTLFPTLSAFGLQFRFQPRVDASRAALIYLMEPIFASLFAWIVTGHGLGSVALLGGGLIVVANLLVELVSSRSPATPVMD